MTQKPISLSKFRKTKVRASAKSQADANALKFGRPKTERDKQKLDAEIVSRRLDGHKRDESDS